MVWNIVVPILQATARHQLTCLFSYSSNHKSWRRAFCVSKLIVSRRL